MMNVYKRSINKNYSLFLTKTIIILKKEHLNCYLNIFLFQDYDSTDLADFAKTIMKGCDTNRDGKISKKVKIVKRYIGIFKMYIIYNISGTDHDPDCTF